MADTQKDDAQEEEEEIPQFISDNYLKIALQKAEEFIKELRSQENYKTAKQFLNVVKILENVHFQLKAEEQKAQDLLDQHVDATGRIEEAVKISQRDRDIIEKLKQEVKNAWDEADAAKLREQHTSESLNVARERYNSLKESTKGRSMDYEPSDDLGDHKMTVLQQCEKLNVEVDELNKRLLVQRAYTEELQSKLEEEKDKNQNLFREWDLATNQSMSNKSKIEKLQKKNDELNEMLENTSESLFHFRDMSETRYKRLMERDKQVQELSEKLEKAKGDNNMLNLQKTKLEQTIKSYRNDFSNFKHDIDRFHAYIRQKDEENKKLYNEREQEVKKVENLVRKMTTLEKLMAKQDQDLMAKKTEIVTAEKERDLIKKASDNMKRENEKLQKNAEQMLRDMERLNAQISSLKQDKEKMDEEHLLLKNTLKATSEREQKSASNVKKLQNNIEVVESEKLYMTEQMKQLNEDIINQKKHIENMKQELIESNQQVAYYKREYAMSLKNLKEARSDYQRCHEKESEIMDRLMKYRNQIGDVNDKLTSKLTEIVSLMKKIQRLEKKSREIKREYEKSQDSLRLCRIRTKDLDHENKLLKEEIRENQTRFIKMKNQADKVLRERDLIATQMYRKADENSLLEDQVSMLKMSIERGTAMYNDRMEDIRVMKIEIQSLRSQCNVLKRGLQNTTDMRHEVMQLHRKLNQERTKAKVLEEEMTTPMNVHRWRKLGHKDPNRMELIRKCQRLQRNCMKEAAKNVKAEEIIKLLEEKIERLQKNLKTRPSSEVTEKLMVTRSQLELNTKRMKAAVAISRATASDLNLKDHTINQLEKELNEVKSQLFKEKRSKHSILQKFKKKPENGTCDKHAISKLKSLGNAFKIELLK